MNPGLIVALINQVVVPEILEIVRRRQAAGQTITDAEIIAELANRAQAVIAQGQAWLDAHPT